MTPDMIAAIGTAVCGFLEGVAALIWAIRRRW
jgi:hypothetical protein